jgi:dihydroorotate dehydrogenase electron transfer subunit
MDEKPMSVAEVRPSLQLAIARAGPCSKKLAELKSGECIYVRGPLGKPFWPVGKRWLMVGGGYGFAPLRYLARVGLESGMEVESICGARSKGLLMKNAPGKNYQTTDDGSAGVKGNVITALEPLLANSKTKFDCVYSCGPEKMMKAVALACKKAGVKSQLSVERYMKCGIGVCGHCAMGGWLSCIDGPAIGGEEALENPEFGVLHKDRAGRKVKY